MPEEAKAGETWAARRTRWLNRLHARRAARTPPPDSFESVSEPRMIGSVALGRQLLAGDFLFAGHLVEAPDTAIWDIEAPGPGFERARQGFGWLDDLAALGDARARRAAQDWTWGWIARHGKGRGEGWTPELAGRRLVRWVQHAPFLLRGQTATRRRDFLASLAGQTVFVSKRWSAAPAGRPRIEALCGLILSTLSQAGTAVRMDPALRGLAKECGRQIDAGGALRSRNPEELLDVFTLLSWTSQALEDAGRTPPGALTQALERSAPVLRALRHADGGLARFHGGGRGAEGRLDLALSAWGRRTAPPEGPTMGYARLAAGRTSVIMDAAPPPGGPDGHASTLAFELTSGRRPLIVNCGSGATFGETWRRAGRSTQSHSTLGLDGVWSSRLAAGSAGDELRHRPGEVRLQRGGTAGEQKIVAGHDGYIATHGLTHVRTLVLSRDGRTLTGEDTLGALSEADRALLERRLGETGAGGVPFSVRFHLHPSVEARMEGESLTLGLPSGEVWVFEQTGADGISLVPSVYLERGRLKPRATRQIVLPGRIGGSAAQIGWTLAKAQGTPAGIRDLAGGAEADLSWE
ncbi:heparinase II/III family protein [Tropicimonas sp. IMCC34011]|uniref:heparinase II/III family protein n=1 Tax=Tropicimonas sp. IMCC34011 TaxID=2248759 RepID=UPI000E22CFF0|nr:heparinase II/III family protein [Tropicimonas sp. IMCC34011]